MIGSALIVGAGGLGCPAALVLARAGVGRIAFVDDDVVEVANLHRQVLHRDEDVGRPKAESAADAVRRIDARIEAVAIRARLDASNALDLVRGFDVVLDGSDNFATKFLVNDACVLARLPFVHAAAIRWMGQLLPVPVGGACYRCLFEEPPPVEAGASCREAGVVGPVVGVVGALAAEAALRVIGTRGSGPGSRGRLVVYDGLAGSVRTVEFARNPRCRACGNAAMQRIEPAEYEVAACT